jgi:uncharacterized protein (DUF2141 family)
MAGISLQIFLACLLLSSGKRQAGDSVAVHVTVGGFRNSVGMCRLLLFDRDKGFPDTPEEAIVMRSDSVHGKAAAFSFKVGPGRYAISVFHDENGNGTVDKTWYGKPKEGVGASNNPKSRLGAPGFEESAVLLDENHHELTILLNYL